MKYDNKQTIFAILTFHKSFCILTLNSSKACESSEPTVNKSMYELVYFAMLMLQIFLQNFPPDPDSTGPLYVTLRGHSLQDGDLLDLKLLHS
jgi:hypothetical protein